MTPDRIIDVAVGVVFALVALLVLALYGIERRDRRRRLEALRRDLAALWRIGEKEDRP